MDFRDLYGASECPHCGNKTISYRQKINLIDYRYSYTCKECGGTIQLPLWHIFLYISEVISMVVAIVKFNMSSWQAVLCGVLILLFINYVQLPFIRIKG